MASRILLTGADVWDGLADRSARRDVLVEDDSIVRVDDRITPEAGVEVVDLSGHTLTPGFMDCHTHVTVFPDIVGSLTDSSAAGAFRAVPVLADLLRNGFTTIRDLMTADPHFNTIALRDAVAAGTIRGPRMLVAPHLISARGGHGDFSGSIADHFQEHHRDLELAAADGCDEIRTRVREQIRAGADWIKFGATGGFSSPSDDPEQTTYSQEEMSVLVSTAADLGRPATPHCYGDEGVRRAVRAGVRSIEHGNLATAETLRLMEDEGVFLVPTQYTILDDAQNAFDDDHWHGLPAFKQRTIYDLRTAQECEQRPDRVPEGVRRVALDVLADSSGSAAAQLGPVLEDPQQAERLLRGDGATRMFREAYRDIVSLASARRSYRDLFRGILEADGEPALFHCTTGKDRTGWGAASLLLALGIEEDEVRADYLRTNDDLLPALRPLFDRFEQAGGDPELLVPVLGVREEYLDTALDEARARFGGIDGYVREGLGLSDDELGRLSETLLEDA